MSKGRLLFFITEDWYFSMHFLNIALAAKDNGWEVTLVCNTGQKGENAMSQIIASKLNFFPIKLSRSNISPLQDLKTLIKVFKLIKESKPDVIFSVAIKPILIGGVLAKFYEIPFLGMMTGLGYVFSSDSFKAKLIRPFVKFSLRSIFNTRSNKLLVLNREDENWAKLNILKNNSEVERLPGVGVDTKKFFPSKVKANIFTIAYVGRMLSDKGVFELISAIKHLKEKNFKVELMMAGAPDPSNPASIDEKLLLKWEKEGLCKYFGHINNIHEFLQSAHVFILPSYREGLPTSVIEAAAAGLPAIVCDVPGCREAVIDKKTGIIVSPKDPKALSEAISYFYQNPQIIEEMGQASRKFANDYFSQPIVNEKMLKLFAQWAEIKLKG